METMTAQWWVQQKGSLSVVCSVYSTAKDLAPASVPYSGGSSASSKGDYWAMSLDSLTVVRWAPKKQWQLDGKMDFLSESV